MNGLALSAIQFRRKRILAGLIVLLAIAVLFVRSSWSAGDTVHETIENTGLVLILVCVLGRAWATLYIGGRKKDELVRDGPYSIVRNPLYLFSLIGVAGIGAGAGSVALAAVFVVTAYLVFRWVVMHEEAFLLKAHGAAYARYLREVPRFRPDVRLWRDTDRIVVMPKLVVRTTLEASLFFLAYPAFETIEWLQQSGILATPVLLP